MFSGPGTHLLLNHLPVVGFVCLTPFIVFSLFLKAHRRKQLALLATILMSILTFPAFWTGDSAQEGLENYSIIKESQQENFESKEGETRIEHAELGMAQMQIDQHEKAADYALMASLITGCLAAIVFSFSLRSKAYLTALTAIVAHAVFVTAGFMIWTAYEGTKIRHPELIDRTIEEIEEEERAY